MATVTLMKVPSKSGAYSNVLTNWLKFRRDGKDAALPRNRAAPVRKSLQQYPYAL